MFYPIARAANPHTALYILAAFQKCHFWLLLMDRRLRAGWPRAQVRAPNFGARHRIENHESNILCIYIMFISSKLAEIDRFEKGSKRRLLLPIREKKAPPLNKTEIFCSNLNQVLFSRQNRVLFLATKSRTFARIKIEHLFSK